VPSVGRPVVAVARGWGATHITDRRTSQNDNELNTQNNSPATLKTKIILVFKVCTIIVQDGCLKFCAM
jgi:hypothetical protein